VFDMDGTMIDNMSYHTRAWMELSRRLGRDVSPEAFDRDTAGRKTDEILEWLLDRKLSTEEAARLGGKKEARYRELYREHVAPLKGLLDFLARIERAGLKRAVATAAPRENRELVLGALRLQFDAIAGAEDAPRGKPAPDIYLAAARRLGVRPEECVAFEDAANGVLSARAAGMHAAAVTTTTTPEALRAAGARWLFPDFASVPGDLEAMLFGDTK
jgi:HAD superfamily hydrolase (TIGR01509 family)